MPITLKTPRRATWATSLYFPCPRTSYRSQLCFALCTPVDGLGECGRSAGHARLGRTQRAILDAKLRSITGFEETATAATSG
jgi:hypothetical protein